MQKILRGIHHFQQHVFPEKRALFERLASGQNPETLFVGCSDSRIALDLLTQTGPGDLFVCRNAGNIVPPYGEPDAVSASIEYAVCVLGIRDIVVCGHSDCGAMKALVHPEALEEMPHVRDWLRHAEGAKRAAREIARDLSDGELQSSITKLNARLQLEHLGTHPYVFARLQTQQLSLHAWFYDIGSGAVEAWNGDTRSWEPLLDGVATPAAASVLEAQHA